MSASVGAVSIANLEHLLHDLANGGERVERAVLNGAEEAPQLRIVSDRALEVRLSPVRRDREDLAGEIPPPPLLELAGTLEVGPVLGDLRPQGVDAFLAHSLGEHDRH